MTWIKLDDKAPRHPKIAGLSDRAFRWWILGLCYASEFLTDGILLPVFWKSAPKGARAELCDSRLWVWDDPNFVIHDYLNHQQSRETVEAERRRNRDRRNSDRGTPARRTAGTTEKKPRPDTDTEEEIRDQKDHNTHNARATGHGNGANPPGSLPRDHRFHAVCGPNFRVCLTEATAAKLAATWGGAPDDAMQPLRDFSEWLEHKVGDGPKGDHLWLMQHFDAFMVERGRVPIAPPEKSKPVKSDGVGAAIDGWGRDDKN